MVFLLTLSTSLIITSVSLSHSEMLLSTNVPVTVGSDSFEENDIIQYQTPNLSLYLSGSTLRIPLGVNIDALGFSGNDIIFSVDIPTTLDGETYTERDLILYDGSNFSKLLDGLAAGIPDGACIDAATVLADESIVFSLDIPVGLGGIPFKAHDLIIYDGSSFGLYFSGSDNGIPEAADLDGVWVSPSDEILLSLDIPSSLDGLEVNDKDIIKWSGGSFSIYFDGFLAGLSEGSDVDALSSGVDLSLLLLFLFEDNGDTTTDSSGNGNDGSVNGSAFLNGGGILNSNAYQFEWSRQDNIKVAYKESQTVTEALTLEAWIYPTAWDNIHFGYNRIFSKQPVYLLRGANNGHAHFQILTENHGYQGVSDSQMMTLNEWHYVVGTFDGLSLKLYVDGVLRDSLELPEKDSISANESDIFVGESAGLNEGFTGTIDNVAIYKRGRSQSEIEETYASVVPLCEGDFDGDSDVDGSDLSVFAADFGRTDCGTGSPCEGDFEPDGDVDGSDLATFAADFGRTDCLQ
jgi:hypothetical protein